VVLALSWVYEAKAQLAERCGNKPMRELLRASASLAGFKAQSGRGIESLPVCSPTLEIGLTKALFAFMLFYP
jgi:hypothetical protein